MGEKVRISIEWLSGCSGCEVGIVDLHEKLLIVLDEVDFVRIPILMDEKDYVSADIGLITGCIRTEHDIKATHKMRESCQAIIAFGTCPVYGGPQGAAYAHTNEELLKNSFVNNETTHTHNCPENVPELLEEARPINSEIDVDLYLPGCPPHAAYIFESLMALIRNRNPRFGRNSVCYNCKRIMKKTDVSQINKMSEVSYDPELCFLSQGVLCFGSVTLDRCLAPCPGVGVPCFSCGGPTESVILEPQKDIRSEVATRMEHLTKIPYKDIVAEIEAQAKTHFAYAMASPIFQEKPTFLMKKWMEKSTNSKQGFNHAS